jgi:DNA-binding IclR family transcriptional regulator
MKSSTAATPLPTESDADQEGADRSGVQSVTIAATILKALAAEGGMLPLRRLTAATGMPRAKVHRYLISLRATGFIAQDPETGQYRIGPAAVTVGLVGLRALGPVRQLHEALPRLRDRVNETVTAAIWGERGPTIIAIEESDHVVTMNVRVGSVLPLLTTAIGHLFLAYLPGAMVQRIVAAERQAAPSSAVPLPENELAALLAEIRATGLSRARGALLPGVDAIVAPVFDYRGKLVAAICVVGRAEALDISLEGPVARALQGSAGELSRQLGFAETA